MLLWKETLVKPTFDDTETLVMAAPSLPAVLAARIVSSKTALPTR